MKVSKRIGYTAATVAVALALAGGTAAVASAATLPSPSPSTGSSAGHAGTHHGRTGKGDRQHTALSADELAKVTAAVTAKDPGATVKRSWKDADGSFDVVVTSGSTRTRFEVSADYTTVTADAAMPHHHHGGHDGGQKSGGSNDAEG
ncbi:hypothetical protein [Microbacterium capsulatum]|uniref:PepSY domain-containing protein n=1 Tax=Microbacterium capsulatum TaxID=3041921 RepID=A0ABU0XC43_9MICO|nr:hypothetical protein [Microbacterium sp. ASV81]MDQ4212678.1 hypothetical protein [Microbacterium sp. ASV81]